MRRERNEWASTFASRRGNPHLLRRLRPGTRLAELHPATPLPITPKQRPSAVMGWWSEHDQTFVGTPDALGGTWELVDCGMVDVLFAVWARGWTTNHSCEDWGDSTAQVLFRHRPDAETFVLAVPWAITRCSVMACGRSSEPPVAVYVRRSLLAEVAAALAVS